MDKIERILLIDDDTTLVEGLSDSFGGEGVEVIFCRTKDEGIREIESGRRHDLILLDWYLEAEEEQDSSLSRLVLAHLRGRRFIPVFVWSHHIYDFNQTLDAGEIRYPKSLIRTISKDEFMAEVVRGRIQELYSSSIAARISGLYRDVINRELESVFFDLGDIPEGDMGVILKSIVGSDEDLDWSNDFVLHLLHRRLLNKTDFTAKLQALLQAIPGAVPQNALARATITNRIIYYKPASHFIRSGDILKVQIGAVSRYGIVCTPDCDIARPNTRFIHLTELRSIEDQSLRFNKNNKDKIREYKHESYYFLPSITIDNAYQDFVAVLKSKIVLEEDPTPAVNPDPEKSPEPYPRATKRLDATTTFKCEGTNVVLTVLCSISDPYKSDFMHQLHAHDSRVGTPEIKKLWLEQN